MSDNNKSNEDRAMEFVKVYILCEVAIKEHLEKMVLVGNKNALKNILEVYSGNVLDESINHKILSRIYKTTFEVYNPRANLKITTIKRIIPNDMFGHEKLDFIFKSNDESARGLRNKVVHSFDDKTILKVNENYNKLLKTMNEFLDFIEKYEYEII